MVQVIKDPIGTKGARLSSQISIAGRLLVFLPQDQHIGVSQKIPLEQRESLRSRLQKLALDNSNQGDSGGFILRTNGEDASDAELSEDIRYLRKMWAQIKASSLRLPAPSLLRQDLNLLQRVLRDGCVAVVEKLGAHFNVIEMQHGHHALGQMLHAHRALRAVVVGDDNPPLLVVALDRNQLFEGGRLVLRHTTQRNYVL